MYAAGWYALPLLFFSPLIRERINPTLTTHISPILNCSSSRIGVRGAKRLYRGTLEPLFAPEREPNRHHRKRAAATELHKRLLKST
jgi:hypothetical protein